MATWRDVQRMALSFPDSSEMRSSTDRKWVTNGRSFIWERPLRPADKKALGERAPSGPILGVRTDGLEMKEALLGAHPSIYFTTPHFDGYPAVLVRLPRITVKELRDVIREAWLACAKKRGAKAYLEQMTRMGRKRS